MTVNIAEAKSKLSSLVSFVDIGSDEVIISKRDKPMAVLVSYQNFIKMKRGSKGGIEIDKLPSIVDKYRGALGADEVDLDYKTSREKYLKDKYL